MKKALPRRASPTARRVSRVRRVLSTRVFPQPVRTVLALLLWLSLGLIWTVAVSGLNGDLGAGLVYIGLGFFAALGAHAWPTRTPPWRTLAWTFAITIGLGSNLSLLGMGRLAVTISMLAGALFILLRLNENGRKIVGLVKASREAR